MWTFVRITLAALLALQGAAAFADCTRPRPTFSIPEGGSASEKDMAAANTALAEFGTKVRDWGETLVALDDRYEGAGGHRVLDRLHSEAPKVPFITGWVDRDRAVSELRKATAMAPDELSNPLYLAEALLEHEPAKKAEALALLRQVAAAKPRPGSLLEDLSTSAAASKRNCCSNWAS